jgi:septal ring factor EnvC (AmiA/AmiB activator)
MAAQLDELRGLNADLDGRWRQQAEQLGRQLQQLEQQRDEIARQTRELLALEQRRAASNRVGGLFALLVLTGVAALGVHGWPWLRGAVEDLSRVSIGVTELAPELRAVRGQVNALTSNGGQTDGAMAALREDVAGVRSDLSSLRQAVDTLSEAKGPVLVNTGGRRTAAYTPPHSVAVRSNPYRTTRPMMPW